MTRSPRVPSRRSPGSRGTGNAGADALAAATIDAAIIYWRWLGEEFPRYAKAVTVELTALKGRRVGTREATARIARLTQEYTQVLGDLPRRMLAQMNGASADLEAPGSRRRQGRAID